MGYQVSRARLLCRHQAPPRISSLKGHEPLSPRVMMHPKTLEHRDVVLHIKDLERPKKEGDEKARLRDVHY